MNNTLFKLPFFLTKVQLQELGVEEVLFQETKKKLHFSFLLLNYLDFHQTLYFYRIVEKMNDWNTKKNDSENTIILVLLDNS